MSTTTRTICVNATPGDATKAAQEVAENLRKVGKIVTIGKEYVLGHSHKAGMLAVDMTIETPEPKPEAAPEPPAVVVPEPPKPEPPVPPEALPAAEVVETDYPDEPDVWQGHKRTPRKRRTVTTPA